jgi:superfamily I DNA/RNA helicase
LSSKSQPVLLVTGPPGSGKSRFLAKEAIRLHVQEGLALSGLFVLAVSSQNQSRLQVYLESESQLAGLAGVKIKVQTLDAFWLAQVNQGQPETSQWRLLSELESQALTAHAVQSVIHPEHPLFSASQDASFTRLMANLIRQCQVGGCLPDRMMTYTGLSGERVLLLGQIYQQFLSLCQQARLLTYPALAQMLQEQDAAAQSFLPPGQVSALLIDEAQELSSAHYDWLAQLPVRLVLAGNPQLGIRSYRGGQPKCFETFFQQQGRPVTHQVQQANLRNNAPVLSVLNGLLPAPIWEEQAPDPAQLGQMLQFGYYTDAAAEATALVDYLADVVERQSMPVSDFLSPTGSRPATWSDCVVLLRSGRYKSNLYAAFLQRGIPFQDESLSEAVLDFQRDFYALLQVLAIWEGWGLQPEDFQTPEALEGQAMRTVKSSLDWATSLKAHNRYLLRWLEAVLHDTPHTTALAKLAAPVQEAEPVWLLGLWLNREQTSPVVAERLQAMVNLYQAWLQHPDPGQLLDGAVQAFSPDVTPGDSTPELALWASLQPVRKAMAQWGQRFYEATGQGVSLRMMLNQFEQFWQGLTATEPKNQVRLLSVHQAQGETVPVVVMPFLQSEEFPSHRENPEWLSPSALEALGLPALFSEAEERRLFAVAASRASHRLLLTCHQRQDNERVLPSPYYTALLAQNRQCLQCPSAAQVCACESGTTPVAACEVDFCNHPARLQTAQPQAAVESEFPDVQSDYQSNSLWAQLHPQAPEPIFEVDEDLFISPTAITRYMQCPRQYYYKHLLGLKEPGSVAASLGTLIHKVMEAFNSQTPPGEHTPQRLREVAEAFFGFESDSHAFYMAGFGERERQTLSQMSPLAVHALRQSLLASVEDLTEKGYFDRYGSLKAIYAERELKEVTLAGLERCRLSGKMDALIQLADGRWEVVDYKTYGPSKYGTRWELCEQKFEATLEPLPEEPELPHPQRFANKLNTAYPIDYQLPLYYWVAQQDKTLKGGMAGVSLQLVRPQFPDNPAQGSIRLGLGSDVLNAQRNRVLQEIQAHVIDPILASEYFLPVPEAGGCGYCAYAGICEQGNASEREGLE